MMSFVAVALALLTVNIGLNIWQSEKQEVSSIESVPPVADGNAQVLISREAGNGITDKDIDIEVAERVGIATLEKVRQHTQNVLDQMGSTDSTDGLTQSSVVSEIEGSKFVVTRLFIGTTNNAIQFLTIKNGEMVRLLCQSSRGDIPVILPGKCATALKEEFGVTIAGNS